MATHKFIVMSLCTLGLYEIYWIYHNWKRIKEATGENLSPFWRAFFAPLWSFSLFRRVRERAEHEGLAVGWRPDLLGALYLVTGLTYGLYRPWSLLFSFIVGFLSLMPVVKTTTEVNARHPSMEGPNSSYSFGNIAGIFLGGGLLILGVLGALMLGPSPGAPRARADGARSAGAASPGGKPVDVGNVPQDPIACAQEADSYASQGDVRKAAALLERCIEADPDRRDAYLQMDRLLEPHKAFEAIVVFWNRYLERHPDDAIAIFERAGTFMHMGQSDRAMREVQRACELGLDRACRVASGGR